MIPVLIPARIGSSRFPRKPLALINETPMILHVCQRAAEAVGRESVYVTTDSDEIVDVVEGAGFQTVLIQGMCETGTDRVAEASRQLGLSHVINVQGDEPMIDPRLIVSVSQELEATGQVVNAYSQIGPEEDPGSLSIPKVVVSDASDLIYCSRALVPSSKEDAGNSKGYLRQVCVYGFTIDQLVIFGSGRVKSTNEMREDLEILRFLDRGVNVRMVRSEYQSIAVDYPEDVNRVSMLMKRSGTHASFS